MTKIRCIAAILFIIILVCTTHSVGADNRAATIPPSPQSQGFAGSVSCRECHEQFYQLWSTSKHGLATGYEGGFRAPAMIRWPGKVPAGMVENGIISGLDWFPTFLAAAGNPNITEELLKGKQIGDRTYKVHLDGYKQMDMITGKGPSNRHEIFYFTESALAAVRIDDFKYRFINQPDGWIGSKVHPDAPVLVNLRLDPFERTGWPQGNYGSYEYFGWFQYEFWRFVFAQQQVAKLAMTALEYPPMQKGASFNLDAVKAKIDEAMRAHGGQ